MCFHGPGLRTTYNAVHKLFSLRMYIKIGGIIERVMVFNQFQLFSRLQYDKDFAAPAPVYYGVLEGVTRPGLGCRILVTRNLSKILPGLLNDLNTWVDETRLKSVRLLYSLLLYSGTFH